MMAIGDDHDDNDDDEEGIAGGAGDDNAGGSESPFSGTFAERMNEGLAELAINVTDPQMHQCQKCTTICLAFLMRLHIMIFYCFYTSTGQF
jgi:hypothetical protein